MKNKTNRKTKTIYRHAGTGRFLSKSDFKKEPNNTVVKETIVLNSKLRKT